MKYLAASITDQGPRKGNQDACFAVIGEREGSQIAFMTICDGMGGFSKGELASAEMVRAAESWCDTALADFPAQGLPAQLLYEQWTAMVERKNTQLAQYAQKEALRLGTTATMVMVCQWEYAVLHIGDCRLYEIRQDGVTQITRDHTVTQRELELGNLTPKQAAQDRRQNVLTQCVGAGKPLRPDFLLCATGLDMVYLLCCDGFRHKLSPEEMRNLFAPQRNTTEEEMNRSLAQAIQIIRERGETDNATAVLLRVIPEPEDLSLMDDIDVTQEPEVTELILEGVQPTTVAVRGLQTLRIVNTKEKI